MNNDRGNLNSSDNNTIYTDWNENPKSFPESNNSIKPYIIVSNSELEQKRKNNKLFFHFTYVFFFLVSLLVFYMYQINKYEFYLKETEVLIGTGSSYQLELIPKNSMNFNVLNYKYNIENKEIATVDEYGRITTLNNGITKLKVRYKRSFSSKEITIKVENIEVEKVDLGKEIKLNTQESIKINPTINQQEDINTNISYQSSDPNIAIVDEYGNVSAVGEGETTIVGTSSNGVSGEVKVKIEKNTKEVNSIRLNESKISIKKGSKTKLITIISPSDAINQNVSWTSSNDNVGVDVSGTIVGNKVGTSFVTATTSNGKSATCEVTVEDTTIEVQSITLNTNKKEMKVGGIEQLIATILPTNVTIRNITWTSSNSNIVSVENGKITAKKVGTATITAKTNNGKSATCEVIVKENDIKETGISLNIANTTLNVGGTVNLTATITPSNATNKTVVWKSNNESVATVVNGKVSAKKVGTTTITATTSNGKSASCVIIVRANTIEVQSISINSSSVSLKVGQTFKLTATITPGNASNQTITWASTDSSVVRVDSNGILIGLKAGTATITAKSNNGKSSSVGVKVINTASLDTIPPSGSCTATLKDGNTIFKVSSNDTDIASYNYNGILESKNSSFTASTYYRNSYVTLKDTSGNQNKIICNTIIEPLPVVSPKSGEAVKYKAESDTLKIYVTSKDGWYLTRIWAYDAVNQLKKHYVTGDSLKRPNVILENAISTYGLKNKIVLGFNASDPIKVGSYGSKIAETNPIYNLKEPSSLLIKNGEVIINDYIANTAKKDYLYYIDGSNQLKYITNINGITAEQRQALFQQVINSGAKNTMVFHPALVENYQARSIPDEDKNSSNANRQALCQIDSNNFILITTKTSTMKLQAFANYVATLGCKTAVNFDGGGSISTFFKEAGTNTIKVVSGNDRSLSAVFFFTELN